MQMELKSHQTEALEFLANKEGAGLFFEMGLGKTLTSLEHIHRKKLFPCLIVCPLSVVSVWGTEVEKFEYPYKVIKLTGTKQERIAALKDPTGDIFVINYDGLRVIKEELMRQALRFKCLILDESHRIKGLKSQQTSIALELGKIIPYRYILSGTPVTKSPEDIWPQLHFVKPYHLDNFWNFRGKHVEMRTVKVFVKGQKKEIKVPHRFKRLDELEQKISEVCIRRTKEECLDLPDKIYKRIPCPMEGDQLKAYHELRVCLQVALENEETFRVNGGGTLVNKLRQICQGFVYDQEKEAHFYKSNTKIKILTDLLSDLTEPIVCVHTGKTTQQKIILFAYFQAEMDQLSNALSEKYRVIRYGGNEVDRSGQIAAFQNSDEPVIFLCQIDQAIGINLTCSHQVIYYSNSWNYGTRYQSEDRTHRIGQDKNVIYYDLVCPNSIDEHVLDLLTIKKDLADHVTGDLKRIAESYLKGVVHDA